MYAHRFNEKLLDLKKHMDNTTFNIPFMNSPERKHSLTQYTNELISFLQNGSCWYVNPRGEVPDYEPLFRFPINELNLPFPVTSIIYKDHERDQTYHWHLLYQLEPSRTAPGAYEKLAIDGFKPKLFLTTVSYRPGTPFYISPFGFVIGTLNGGGVTHIQEHEFSKGMLNYLKDKDQDFDEDMQEQSNIAVRIVVNFLAFLHCSNVTSTTVTPPARLNKARKKRGKLPMLEYKVLTVNGVAVGNPHSLSKSGKSEIEMRFHHRRGHYGHRWKGPRDNNRLERTWISPCAVGNKDKGEVIKDYKVN